MKYLISKENKDKISIQSLLQELSIKNLSKFDDGLPMQKFFFLSEEEEGLHLRDFVLVKYQENGKHTFDCEYNRLVIKYFFENFKIRKISLVSFP